MTSATCLRLTMLVAVSAIAGCGGSGDEEKVGGPLQAGERSSVGIPAKTGQALTFSLPVIYNVSDSSDVTLDRVELERPDKDVEMVGSLTTGNSRRVNYQDADERFPPTSRIYGKPRPLEGTRVPPVESKAGEAGVELIIGVKARKSGRVGARGLVLHYRDGDQKWRVRVPNAFVLCAAAKLTADTGCEEPPLPPEGDTKVGRS